MQAYCIDCGDAVPESMGSVKAGDLAECWKGLRPGRRLRVLCGTCATFYANVRWRSLVRPLWVRLPFSVRKLWVRFSRATGISLLYLA